MQIARAAVVAAAALKLWQITGQQDRADTAMFLYGKLLEKRPQNAVFLRAMAVLSERFGPKDQALDCWRRLAATRGMASR